MSSCGSSWTTTASRLLTLNRPDKLKRGPGPRPTPEFGRVLRELAADDRAKVAVVTGAGRAFSVGR